MQLLPEKQAIQFNLLSVPVSTSTRISSWIYILKALSGIRTAPAISASVLDSCQISYNRRFCDPVKRTTLF
jgi:hypothetical protein